jgi:nucleoside-diphosphate-sugar epimerase
VRALITGDRGFLGRHFTAELKRRGYEVHGMDVKATYAQDCRTYFRRYVTRGEFYQKANAHHFDLVVHCAAVVGGRETIERDPLKTAESLSIDAEMFRWAAVARPGRVLYISSSAAYPVAYQRDDMGERTPLSEILIDSPRVVWEPDEVYGWSKVTGELLADRLRKTGVPVTVVRPFSGYGADQNPSYPFRAILNRVKERNPGSLEVWCGDCVRDFIHVDDLVAGALAVAESGTEDPVNLCNGIPVSFFDLARLMLDLSGQTDVGILGNPDKPQGVAYRVGDPTRMIQYYTPKIMIGEGIKRALDA